MLNELVEKTVAAVENNSEVLAYGCLVVMAIIAAVALFRAVAWLWHSAAVKRRTLRQMRRVLRSQQGATGCNAGGVPRHNHKCKQYGRAQAQGQGEIVGM